MTFNGIRPSVVGMPWYKRADYRRILEIMDDAEQLPTTFDKWQGRAESMERQQIRAGIPVIRAYIDPDKFVAWCAETGCKVDAEARMAWGNLAAYRTANGQH